MEIAENIFHFNDKRALENQSSETSEVIYSHFWESLQENNLVREFLLDEVFRVPESYHSISFHPEYGAAILYKTLDSLEVFIRVVGLDKWESKIHASVYERERFAVPKLDDPVLLEQGPFPTHLVDELEGTLMQALQQSEMKLGASRRNDSEHEGNQKTPSFLNEKLDQSIKKVALDNEKQIKGDLFFKLSSYGGTTDVGRHTGGKPRNTAAPLVFSVISTMLQLEDRPSKEFKSLIAIYLISFLDEFPKVTVYDGRAIDRYIIVMLEAKQHIEELENERLKQKIVKKLRLHHFDLYSLPYGTTHELELCKVSKILRDLSAPEFPKAPPLPQMIESESFLETSRRHADENLKWIDMKSKLFKGTNQEVWVQLHALNIRFWKATATINEKLTSESVVELKKDLKRLSKIVDVAFGTANEGRYTMSVVIKSYELLATVICFCFAHREVEGNHEWLKNYTPAFDPNNLDHLVLDDKRAIDSADQVRAFLETRQQGTAPLRNHEITMKLARGFASGNSAQAIQNKQIHQDFLAESSRMISKRWKDIENIQDQLRVLDDKLERAQRELNNAKKRLSEVEANRNYYSDRSYRSRKAEVSNSSTEVSDLEEKIKSLERKPKDLVFSLPEGKDEAEVLLFFMFMDCDFRNLAELAHRAESLLWSDGDIPATGETGQNLGSWLGVSRGLSSDEISEGMIRLFCPTVRDITCSTPDIRSYNRRTGVFFSSLRNFCIGWEETSPFEDSCRDSARVFTESFDPKWTGLEPDENTEFTMSKFLVAHTSPERENMAPAKPEMKPFWLAREQYHAFASLRVTGRTQVRSLLNSLFDNLLPLDNPCVHILMQQALFQIGANDWKTDLKPEWHGLKAMETFLRGEVGKLRHAPKYFECLLLAGIISGYYGQFHEALEDIAIEAAMIFDQWANEISLENRNLHLIAKQARFYGYAVLCFASVRMTSERRNELLRILVLYRDRLLLSQDEGDRVLEQGVMKVMGTKWPGSGDNDSMSIEDSLLTSLIQAVVESVPADLDLEWSEIRYAGVESTACFEAVGNGQHFSINLNNGIVLVNGKPKSFLPQSITSDYLFVRHFGEFSPEITTVSLDHYRMAQKVQENFVYDFVVDANRHLHIFEYDLRRGYAEHERLELLDHGNIPFKPHLSEQHSHWINEKQQYLLLRDKSIQSHRIFFAMRPGTLLSVLPTFYSATIEEIFHEEVRFDMVLAGSTPFVQLLCDTGFEEPLFVLVMTDQNGAVKYSLPRYGLSFVQTDEGIRSEDFKGYNVAPKQKLTDTLPGFKSFLLLSNAEGENMVIIPCGEVLKDGGIEMQQSWDSRMSFHMFRVHPRFRHLQAATTLGRLHLACLYASTGCLVPDRRSGKTGMTIAVELLRQCFQNFCFSEKELAKLQNLSKHSGLCSTLRLLVWCIYRWSRSLQLPYQRTLEKEDHLNLDKMAADEYHISPTGPYLTSAEEKTVFCRTLKESIEENGDILIPRNRSKTAKYVRKIERERFQSLLTSEKRNCSSEFPFVISKDAREGERGGEIWKRVQADLKQSYRTYCELQVKKVDFRDVEVSGISREVCSKREAIEKQVLDALNEALNTKKDFDFVAGSMRKFVNSDLVPVIYETSFIWRLKPMDQGNRWVADIQSKVRDWALLCVLEDKIFRVQRFAAQEKDVELIQELQCTRIWEPKKHPRWLAFEVEQQLQIRPEQFKTVNQLLQNPTGSTIQLNMGSGKTRVMVPMLVLELCRQRRKLVRINILSSILQEALLFYQQSLVASIQHIKVFTLPFVRDYDIDDYKIKILEEELKRCHNYGGCIIMTPQHRNSLLLKQHESNVEFDELPEEDVFDVIDESDAILEPKFQLVYAIGAKQDLPSRSTRCSVLQSLLSILSSGECTTSLDLLENSKAFYKEDSEAGCFGNLRVIKLSNEERNRLTRSMAEHFVRNPRSGFEWLQKVERQEDVEILVRMISDPEFQGTSATISRFPLFARFEDDILSARGFLAYGILLHCLEARWGVSYGLRHLRDDDTQMAVPYSASDTPKPRAEFSHPDVAIAYTNLSYLHVGLTKGQFRMALELLDAKGLTVKLSMYADWVENVQADVPTDELDQFDKYEKVDPSNLAQFELMHRRLNRCMEVVFFWLNEVVFPADTMQYPQRRISSAWNLVDSKYVIGFSGTDDNRFVLPYQVKQIRHTDEELRATNGKMIDLVLSCTKNIHHIPTDQSPIWRAVLSGCFDLKVQALIDTGGLMAGCKIDSVFNFLAEKLKCNSVFEGFLYYSTNKERWEVFEFATGRTQSIARSTLSPCDCFVFFDESRCRGTDLKLRRDSLALVTLDKRLTKDKFLQGCARMRQLFPGGQSLILAGTSEIVTESSTALSLLDVIIENGIKTVERGLRTFMQRARNFATFPKPVDDVLELRRMYSKRLVQNESFLEWLDREEEAECSKSNFQFFKEVTEYAKLIGSGVDVDSGIGVEECEKEVHAESEQEEQREAEVAKQEPRSQVDWDYQQVFIDPNSLFGPQFYRLSDLIDTYGIAGLRGIRWSKNVYCTVNFWETIQNTQVSSALCSYLRPVDPMIVLPDKRVVLISLYELDNLLPLWWAQPSRPVVSIDHVFRHTSNCPPLGNWSLPVPTEVLTSVKLFRGDVIYKSNEEKHFLREMLRDLDAPIETIKELLSTRNRLSRYEKSDLATEAYLLSLPSQE